MAAAEMKNRDNIGENEYSEVFRVAAYIRLRLYRMKLLSDSKFKMADLIWPPPK